MRKVIVILGILTLSAIALCSIVLGQEETTITTYYPSPNGVYDSMYADKLGVGDNDGSTTINAADVPSTAGDVWIAGNVGIGTATPASELDVNGTANATVYSVGGTAGYNGTITPNGSCTITVTNGIITGTTCP